MKAHLHWQTAVCPVEIVVILLARFFASFLLFVSPYTRGSWHRYLDTALFHIPLSSSSFSSFFTTSYNFFSLSTTFLPCYFSRAAWKRSRRPSIICVLRSVDHIQRASSFLSIRPLPAIFRLRSLLKNWPKAWLVPITRPAASANGPHQALNFPNASCLYWSRADRRRPESNNTASWGSGSFLLAGKNRVCGRDKGTVKGHWNGTEPPSRTLLLFAGEVIASTSRSSINISNEMVVLARQAKNIRTDGQLRFGGCSLFWLISPHLVSLARCARLRRP